MKFGVSSRLIAAMAVVTTFGLFSVDISKVQPAVAQTTTTQTANTIPSFVALTSNNTLVRYNSSDRSFSNPVRVTGIRNNGTLLGIDYRPANGRLYGLTDTNEIYTINPSSGAATRVSRLSVRFEGGFQSGIDFNPQVDRLRVVGSNDQNFRINVDTGEVIVDTGLTLPKRSDDPNVTAEAYDQSFAGPPSPADAPTPTRPTPELYGVGYNSDFLLEQDPPNDGTLKFVGPLGVNIAPIAGFDIFTNSRGNDTGYVLSGSSLYTVNLNTGTARKVLSVPNGGFVGFAIRPVPLSGR